MRSSSKLFPVRLAVSEAHGGYNEDTYILKPKTSSDASVEVAVTCLTPVNVSTAKPPVICFHGMFNNRMIWHTLRNNGLADALVSQGHQVWLPELRGHGHSPINNDYLNNTFEDIVANDLPAIAAFIHEKTNSRSIWMGHTLGGFLVAAGLARGTVDTTNVLGMVLIGAQVEKPHWILNIPLGAMLGSWIVKKKPFIEGYKLGYGPENEPGRFVAEILKWQTRRGWRAADKFDYLKALESVDVPAFVASFDESEDLARKKQVLFSHLGTNDKTLSCFQFKPEEQALVSMQQRMILGTFAKREVWPKVIKWCEKISQSASLRVA